MADDKRFHRCIIVKDGDVSLYHGIKDTESGKFYQLEDNPVATDLEILLNNLNEEIELLKLAKVMLYDFIDDMKKGCEVMLDINDWENGND